jgi:hypothetical protein
MKTKLSVVVINETKEWNESFLQEHDLTKIEAIYVYDANVATNLCELRPSYELNLLYYHGWNGEDICSDEANEAILMEHDHENDIQYYHCSSIDNHAKPFQVPWYNFEHDGAETEDYRSKFEDIVEQLNCNHPV